MRKRLAVAIGIATLAMVAAVSPSLAGWWATVELDSKPVQLRAGELTRVGFTVMRHGQTPVYSVGDTEVTPHFTARHPESGRSVRVAARKEGGTGHFVTDVQLPVAGEWTWEITPDPLPLVDTTFEPLTVLPPVADEGGLIGAGALRPALVGWIGAASAVALLAGMLATRRVRCARGYMAR